MGRRERANKNLFLLRDLFLIAMIPIFFFFVFFTKRPRGKGRVSGCAEREKRDQGWFI
jgi:hypothetical protein